ncbi:hypothetical protein [Olsenella phocaeensis]|uniref:hypothetical protein n=1 Tax=Olsenella phocaeensis TaxID=1852385 RepID=UPI003A8FDADD
MACALLVAAATAAPVPLALACGGEGEPRLELRVPRDVELDRIDVRPLPVEVAPSSIEVGRSCGMTEMCGLDPCLCGARDQWGACACNGGRTERPSLWVGLEREGVVAVARVGEVPYLVSVGSGSTDAVVVADLAHHGRAEGRVRVSVRPFGPTDALKLAVPTAAVAALAAAVRSRLRRGLR